MDNNEQIAKNPLDDEQLDLVNGGTDDDGWYNGYGFPPEFPNGCPKCGKGVYRIGLAIPVTDEYGTFYLDDFECESCDYKYSTDGRYPIGY